MNGRQHAMKNQAIFVGKVFYIFILLIVSTGGFTSDCKHEVRSSHTHLELIDFDRFINLWQEFYEKLPDEDKKRLPLTPIYFLGI